MAVGEARGRGSGRAPPGALRVLVSFTPEYAAYGEALFLRLREARQGVQTTLVPFREAGEAVARLRPHLVVSDGAVVAPGVAKARIASEPTEPSTMRRAGVVRTVVNPSLEDLLDFIEEVAESVREDR